MIINKKKASLLASTVIFGSLVASPAYAQVTPQDPTLEPGAAADTIIVTGSRIQRRDTDTAAPVAVVDSEEFELSGTVNVENVVNTLPQVVPGTTSFSNNPGNGTASLNLRGLGATRTMLLVNGRRWMFYDANQIVDLNTIPQFLLDSVDVVTGGASAVYGSDALAGVVNFRLRDLNGAEFGGQYGITDAGDGDRYEIHGALGTDFADGRGNVTVYAEYYNRDPIFQGDRGFSEFNLGGDPLVQGGSSFVPQSRLAYQGNVPTADPVLVRVFAGWRERLLRYRPVPPVPTTARPTSITSHPPTTCSFRKSVICWAATAATRSPISQKFTARSPTSTTALTQNSPRRLFS